MITASFYAHLLPASYLLMKLQISSATTHFCGPAAWNS